MKHRRIMQIAAITLIVTVLMAAPVKAVNNLPYYADVVLDDGGTEVDAGDFTASSNGVRYDMDESGGWRLMDTYLYIGDVPPSKIKLGKFPYGHTGLGGAISDEYEIDLAAADLDGDGVVYLAAYANLTKQTGVKKNGKPVFADAKSWVPGDGLAGKGKNQVTYFTVTLSPVG